VPQLPEDECRTMEAHIKDKESRRFAEPSHLYRLVNFSELPPRIVGPDGRCTCTCADYCPLERKGYEPRCTLKELEQLDHEAQVRRGYQSGG
jgi:hypothetical protein